MLESNIYSYFAFISAPRALALTSEIRGSARSTLQPSLLARHFVSLHIIYTICYNNINADRDLSGKRGLSHRSDDILNSKIACLQNVQFNI